MNTVRVAFFLALRSILQSSISSTLLIVSIMTLTFLNLVVVSGILVGLTKGLSEQIKTYYSSDLIIEPDNGRNYIVKSTDIIDELERHPDVIAYSPRYIGSGRIEANYERAVRSDEKTDGANATIVGLDVVKEDSVAGISQLILEGEFLSPNDHGMIVLGSKLIEKYNTDPNMLNNTITDTEIGDTLRLKIEDKIIEVKLKGILKSKVDNISQRMYMTERDLRMYLGRTDLNRGEIVVKLRPNVKPETLQTFLMNRGYGEKNSIKTWKESLGTFFDDISATFNTLGNFVGSIGLFIASITIFIIIFVNAINRRKYIGIMKAIGIQNRVIELSYMLQSVFYSVSGSALGLLLLFFGLVPYFERNPIDFPFSDGILATTVSGALTRACILITFSIIAAYIPARIIVKQNTIDAILDR